MCDMHSNRLRVLVINNDSQISKLLRISFRAQRYEYDIVSTGRDGISCALKNLPDLVILDLELPDMDGKEVVREIRERLSILIIVLTSRDQDGEKVAALDAGADDYITKPFSMEELLARIRALLRRSMTIGTKAAVTCGGLVIDLVRCRVNVNGKKVNLSTIEYKILKALAQQNGKVLTHQQLLAIIKGTDEQVGDNHYIRQYISLLRQKIEENPAKPEYIITDVGHGYRLDCR